MIPFEYQRLAQIIHQERIQKAQARRPEYMYSASPSGRARHELAVTRAVRRMVAQALRRLAARFDPTDSAWQTPSTPRTAITQ